MAETTKNPPETNTNLDRLRSLRDELRVKAHLAKMEVKDRWKELEPKVTALVDEADKGTIDLTREVVDDAIHALEKLRAAMS
jgi:hypothetical protein